MIVEILPCISFAKENCLKTAHEKNCIEVVLKIVLYKIAVPNTVENSLSRNNLIENVGKMYTLRLLAKAAGKTRYQEEAESICSSKNTV